VFVKEDKASLKFLGHFVLFVNIIWDGLSVPKGYSVLGALCPLYSRNVATRDGTSSNVSSRDFSSRYGLYGWDKHPPPQKKNFVGNLPRGHGKLYKENTTAIHMARL
jgi:hypothetical protein